MDIHNIIELIGYLGSFLVIVSMLMTSVVKLRIINTTGSVIFAGYALCIHSYPTAAMQACLIIINIISLYRLFNTKKEYSAIKLNSDDSYAKYFIQSNKTDIQKYFPNFSQIDNGDSVYMICCGEAAAGLFVANDLDNELNVKLDYTTPAYRDCSVGKFLYAYLAKNGISTLVAKSESAAHEKYLIKMGFTKEQQMNQKNTLYLRHLHQPY